MILFDDAFQIRVTHKIKWYFFHILYIINIYIQLLHLFVLKKKWSSWMVHSLSSHSCICIHTLTMMTNPNRVSLIFGNVKPYKNWYFNLFFHAIVSMPNIENSHNWYGCSLYSNHSPINMQMIVKLFFEECFRIFQLFEPTFSSNNLERITRFQKTYRSEKRKSFSTTYRAQWQHFFHCCTVYLKKTKIPFVEMDVCECFSHGMN